MKKNNLLLVFLLILLIMPFKVFAEKVNIYLFHSYTCPHCKEELKFFDEYENENINLYTFEIMKDTNAYNRNLFNKAIEIFKLNPNTGVPLTIIGDTYYVGFNDTIKEELIKTIDYYENNEYNDTLGVELGLSEENLNGHKYEKDYKLETIFGTISLKNLSLPLVAIIMGLVDGFNPCAMWILLFLISLLFNMENKKKMWVLGLTFLTTSALMYFVVLMAWLSINNVINTMTKLQIVIGIVSLIFGSYNLYKYYKEKKSDTGCTVVNKKERKFITNYIKNTLSKDVFVLSIVGIMILAIIVNLIELACSIGLPMMFTEILSLNNLSYKAYILYIILYIIFFMIDDYLVFIISMITLKQTAISTKFNKYSHLLAGIIMLIIGILIIFFPNILTFSF